MRINKIKIFNFGPFYGEHQIEFNNNGYGVHIIRGDNGQGKTSILRAILWCLYGKIYDRNNNEIVPTSIINKRAVDEANNFFSVSMIFEHENKEWSIIRKMQARSNIDNLFYKGEELHIIKNLDPQANPELIVERIIPGEVRNFFFFDGEMLRDYEELLDENSSNMRRIKNYIELVLGIPYLRIGRDDLDRIIKGYESELSTIMRKLGNKDYTSLASDLEIINRDIGDREKRIEKLENDIIKVDDELKKLKRRQTEIDTVKKDALRRLFLEKQISDQELLLAEEKQKIKNLNKNLYKNILFNVSENIIKKLEIEHEKVMNKYDKKQGYLKELSDLQHSINNVKCKLCGHILDEDKLKEIELQIIETKKNIELYTEVPEPNLNYENYSNILKKLLKENNIMNEYTKIQNKIDSINMEIEKINSELSIIISRLQNVDEKEPFEIEKQITNYIKEQGRLEGEIKSEKGEIMLNLDTKSELEQRLNSINEREINIYNKRIELANKIKKLFDLSVAIYRDEKRKEVEKEATNIFLKIRSKEDFNLLIINENYGLSIITKNGTKLDKAELRSAGEEQLVALSLVGALNKCAHIKAPVFMDTPFGRLDIKHGKRVINYLPEMSEQTIILVTDREFRKEDEKILEGKIKTDLTTKYLGERDGSIILKTNSGDVKNE